MRDIKLTLSKWGAWARGIKDNGYNQLRPEIKACARKAVPCIDAEAAYIDAAVSKLKQAQTHNAAVEHEILLDYYVYGAPIRDICHKKDLTKNQVEKFLNSGEAFVLGALSYYDIVFSWEF